MSIYDDDEEDGSADSASIIDCVDPFEVIGEKPGDKAYQWIALSVAGSEHPYLTNFDTIVSRGGWEVVPPDRHPGMPRDGDRIVHGGCVLMERDADLHVSRVNKEKAKALQLQKSFDEAVGVVRDGRYSGKSLHGTISAATTPQEYVQATEPETVEVTIPLRLAPELVTAASVCAITPQEYARRAIIMLREGRLNYMLLPTEDRQAFELFNRLIVSRPGKGNAHD